MFRVSGHFVNSTGGAHRAGEKLQMSAFFWWDGRAD